MTITYFFRNPSVGYSIGKVFDTIIPKVEDSQKIKRIYMPHANSMPWDVIKNGIYVYKNRNREGINHITGSEHYLIFFLPRCKKIVTVHDLGFYTQHKFSPKSIWKYIIWILSLKLADKVVCISEQTKKTVLKYISIKETNITVIYNPSSNDYKPFPKIFNKISPVILHVGTGQQKNLLRTIEALYKIKCHLRIIGVINEEIAEYLNKYKIDYSNVYDLTDREIIDEYKNCDIVNFPSLHEGFGMPIIEGQAIGRIIVTSDLPPMNEVAGDGAYLVDPYCVGSIRSAYNEIISNEHLQKHLIVAGFNNIGRYSVKAIAEQYIELYKQI